MSIKLNFGLGRTTTQLFLLVAVCGSLFAQGLGTIVGTVTDPSGAVVPSATVRVTDEGTSLARETTTNDQGYYVFPSLRPSSYSLGVVSSGFGSYVRKGIVLQADQSATVNVTLSLRQASETITVEAPPPQVDTSTATLGSVVDRRRVIELPLNGRNAASLALITAGTVLAPASADEGNTKTFPATVTISSNGSRQNQASFRLDGASNNDIYTNVNQPFPFPDAVQEFSVQTSNYSSRYGGNAGGVVNIVTKSGANEVHGNLFEFNRNAVFNARNFFAAKRDQLKRNTFGGTLGGPVSIPHLYNGKNKTFVFMGYQGRRDRNTGLGQQAYVPTPANLNGDFSALLSATDPNNPIKKKITIFDPTSGNQPFSGNKIPLSQLDPASLALTKYLPVTGGNGQVFYGAPSRQRFDEMILRLDHSISEKDRVSGRYFFDRFENSPFLDLKNYISAVNYTVINSHNVMLNETHTFSGTLLNDFRMSFAREVADRGPAAGSISVADLGVKIWQPGQAKSIEGVGVTGYFSIGQNNPATFTRNQYSINDVVNWVRGSHSIMFGADIIRGQVLLRNQFHQPAAFTFTADYNGDAMASFLQGGIQKLIQGNGEYKDNLVNSFGLFFQDDYHVSRRLTLNLGVRFDPFFPWKETKGRFEVFYPDRFAAGQKSQMFTNAPAGLMFQGDPGVPQYGLKANLKNWSPRVGLAYDVTGNGKTSIRAGFGSFYDSLQNGIYNNRFVDLTPFSTQTNITFPPGPFSDPYRGIRNPFPAPAFPPPKDIAFDQPLLVLTYDPANGGVYQTPVVYTYNFMIERQLTSDWLLRAGYVGSQSRHLLETQELSPAVYIPGSTLKPDQRRYFPGYGSISLASQDINSGYNSLQVTAEKRFSKGLTVLANYTWSKSLDTLPFGQSVTTVGSANSGGSSLASPIPWYLPGRHQFDRGPSEFDHKHRFVTSFVWQLPALAKSAPILRYTLGGWQLSGLLQAQSGGPITVLANGKDQSGTALGADRAVLVNSNVYGPGACSSAPCVDYINPAAFAAPAAGTYGNVGKGALRGPKEITLDSGVFKEIPIRAERVRLQVRAEFFNLFNRANFRNPGLRATDLTGNGVSQRAPVVASGGFGSIIAATDPRIGQLALKLMF